MVESAISRSDTTGFLSLSRSTVSCDPDEIIRARCAARSTRSNRLSTLSMQSSTVTRAIDCRSVNKGLMLQIIHASVPNLKFALRGSTFGANFGFERTLENYNSSAVLVQKFPWRTLRYPEGNF